MKILIVDDNIYAIIFIKDYLAMNNCQDVDAVNTGQRALELLKQKKYDLIFIDIKLPDINGFEIVHYLKDNNNQANIVMMTAYPDMVIKNKFVNYEIEHILLKPFNIEQLDSIINKHCLCS